MKSTKFYASPYGSSRIPALFCSFALSLQNTLTPPLTIARVCVLAKTGSAIFLVIFPLFLGCHLYLIGFSDSMRVHSARMILQTRTACISPAIARILAYDSTSCASCSVIVSYYFNSTCHPFPVSVQEIVCTQWSMCLTNFFGCCARHTALPLNFPKNGHCTLRQNLLFITF